MFIYLYWQPYTTHPVLKLKKVILVTPYCAQNRGGQAQNYGGQAQNDGGQAQIAGGQAQIAGGQCTVGCH